MRKVLQNQGYHLLVYITLATTLYVVTAGEAASQNEILGMTAAGWVYFSWFMAFVFQAWILFFWRLELYHGIISALAHHILVWTHYFCTEKPDLKEIYVPEA